MTWSRGLWVLGTVDFTRFCGTSTSMMPVARGFWSVSELWGAGIVVFKLHGRD
ncbi:unnamed protein product [Tuber melanosporum]|uniref:(Perigord truffle) hypothetical protein n=1 Tax=Tuber melanosporum (strain Mel28) TaxID=656061 RepID=D5GCY4_TUBMM|nr:uncharacterized protein GSTUM_00000868001 [Tuber melanosporum]CAZ82377.1 unnamed protein product [Tuber melanosporum]